jgi:hypothetical protein
MGYVIKGKVAFRSGDREEVFEAGDAYYAGPGHTPVLFAGTEWCGCDRRARPVSPPAAPQTTPAARTMALRIPRTYPSRTDAGRI